MSVVETIQKRRSIATTTDVIKAMVTTILTRKFLKSMDLPLKSTLAVKGYRRMMTDLIVVVVAVGVKIALKAATVAAVATSHPETTKTTYVKVTRTTTARVAIVAVDVIKPVTELMTVAKTTTAAKVDRCANRGQVIPRMAIKIGDAMVEIGHTAHQIAIADVVETTETEETRGEAVAAAAVVIRRGDTE